MKIFILGELMGRPERPIGPSDGLAGSFAQDLRSLREKAGNPSYRTMARRTHYSLSTLSKAADGIEFPSLAVTLRYVRACGGDVQDWERRWHEVSAALKGGSVTEATPTQTATMIPIERGVASVGEYIPLSGAGSAAKPATIQGIVVAKDPAIVGETANDRPVKTSAGARKGIVAVAVVTAVSLGAVTVWALTTEGGPAPVVAGSTLPTAESMGGVPVAGSTPTMTASPLTTAEQVASDQKKEQVVGRKGGSAKGVGRPSGSGGSTGSIGSSGSAGSSAPPKGPLTGPGCPSTEANQTDIYAPDDGWHSASGGWSGNGCDGTVKYTQLTGSDGWEDDFGWQFTVSKGAHCRFTTYIPNTSRAGAIAAYDIYGPDQGSLRNRIASYSIDQRTHHGTWLATPSYTFPDGVAQLWLVDRGTPGGATVAASATVISCS